MRISFKHIGLAAIALSLGACADSAIDENAFYGDLSEAEQVEYMAEVVAVLNTETEKASFDIEIDYNGDTERDIITATGTYEKGVTPKQLKKATTAIAKSVAKNPLCYEDYVIPLTNRGIGFQNIMKDPNGIVIYESEICEGMPFAHRPYREQTEEQQSYTLKFLAKGYEAMVLAENLQPNSIYKISFKADALKDIIYGEHAFTAKLSGKDIQKVKAEFGDTTKMSEVCTEETFIKLNKSGIRFEYRVVDYRGKEIVPPWACPAQNAVTVSPVPKLRGLTASR